MAVASAVSDALVANTEAVFRSEIVETIWYPTSSVIEIASPTLNSSKNKELAVPSNTPLEAVQVTVLVPVIEGLSAGQIDIFKLLPKAPAHLAINGPSAANPVTPPPIAPLCSGSNVL